MNKKSACVPGQALGSIDDQYSLLLLFPHEQR